MVRASELGRTKSLVRNIVEVSNSKQSNSLNSQTVVAVREVAGNQSLAEASRNFRQRELVGTLVKFEPEIDRPHIHTVVLVR